MSADPFEEFVAEVNILANLLRKKSAAIHREDDLPPCAFQVLQLLHRRGPLTVPQIGRDRVTSRQNIQIAVNRLREEGLIELASNPVHKRSSLVQLTPKGRERFETALRKDEVYRRKLVSMISDTDSQAAIAYLRQLRQVLSEFQPAVTEPPKPDPVPAKPEPPKPALPDQDEIPLSLL